MIKSLTTGITGLNANAEAMGVIGDNIANVKTVAFKSNSISFANLLGQAMEGNTVGSGVRPWDIDASWSQGAPENTGNETDLAINGRGLFLVKDLAGSTYYSRAGRFDFDKDGYLVNPDGLKVQGYKIDSAGALGDIEDILLTRGSAPPRATSRMSMSLNLDTDADPTIPEIYSTSTTVYDSLGSPVVVTIDFTPTNAGAGTAPQWDWTASVDSSVTSTPVTSSGTLVFDANGNLDPASGTPAGTNPQIAISDLSNGAADLDVEWVYLDDNAATNGGITAYSSDSAIASIEQNGYPSGSLKKVSVTDEGFVSGIYANGTIQPLYRITLADFPNLEGLTGEGNNLFSESLASGTPLAGTPGSGSLGMITPGALELSNVDLTTEFVNMITTQRAYQANSRVITTSDEILAELMNLKR